MAKAPSLVKILAFDCAGNSCSAAVRDDEPVLAHRFVAMERGQAEALLPLIEQVLAESRVGLEGLDLLAVTTGPGGFTGLRIGLATAKGLALARGLPLLGISCFEAVAAAVPASLRDLPLLVALESKRAELYLQRFVPEPEPAALVAPADWAAFAPAGRFVVAGDGSSRLAATLRTRDVVLAPGPGLADAADVARLARDYWRKGERPPPQPLYLRAPDTTIPRIVAAP
jgi:tRNA threonylcarbamoyladenosine biosynthesis protein TsaB